MPTYSIRSASNDGEIGSIEATDGSEALVKFMDALYALNVEDEENDKNTIYYVYVDDNNSFVYGTLEEADERLKKLHKSCIEHYNRDGVTRVLQLWKGFYGEGTLIEEITIDGTQED